MSASIDDDGVDLAAFDPQHGALTAAEQEPGRLGHENDAEPLTNPHCFRSSSILADNAGPLQDLIA